MAPNELKAKLSALPPKIRQVLETAADNGWTGEADISVVVRLLTANAGPIFASWDYMEVEPGNRKWHLRSGSIFTSGLLSYADFEDIVAEVNAVSAAVIEAWRESRLIRIG